MEGYDCVASLQVVGGLVILLTCLAQIYTSKQAGDKVSKNKPTLPHRSLTRWRLKMAVVTGGGSSLRLHLLLHPGRLHSGPRQPGGVWRSQGEKRSSDRSEWGSGGGG